MTSCCPHTPGGPHSALCQGNERALAATAAATVCVLTGHTSGCICKECETLAYVRLPEVVGALAGAEERARALIAHVDSGIVSVAALRHALDGTPMPDGPDSTDSIAARISRRVCSTCWFANGDGESAHCGRCPCCAQAEREKGREEMLRSFRNLAVAQEMEALAEPNRDVRRGMVIVTDMIRSLVEVEEAKP